MLLPWHGSGGEGHLAYTLVQPNIGQDTINDPSLYEGQFQSIARLSLPQRPGARRIVLWPEGGLPDYLRPGYPQFFYNATTYAADPAMARARIGQVIGPGSLLLTGATDLLVEGRQLGAREVTGARNVVTALAPDGAIRGSYAKAHLVPYGEYLPMRAWLAPLGLSRLVSGSLDFLPGPGPRTLDFGPHGKAGLQICYEIIFSGEVTDRAHRPDYIFNPSNDGWFGASGPPQHLAQARMRAIEEGLPVLRSTTTGISAVIDADGVVRAFVPRLTAGRLDGQVPPAHAPTLFARLGNLLALCWALVLFACALVVARRRGER
jgi:apolipoprotein N-acyltransferase